MNVQPYNFRQANRMASDVEANLTAWLRSGCVTAQERWSKHVASAVQLELVLVGTGYPKEAIARLPDSVVAYRILFGESATTTLLAFDRPLAIALVGLFFGDALETLPEDRLLTPVEESLVELLVKELAAGMEEAWSGSRKMRLAVEGAEARPKRTQALTLDETIIVLELAVGGTFGKEAVQWLIPRDPFVKEYFRVEEQTHESTSDARPQLEILTRELPVEVSVELGIAELPVAQLANLEVGDLVILNQRVTEPLLARIASLDKMRVWPGRVGSRQALQVESFLDL